MANPLPLMSPMRTITGGEVVPPSQEPVVQAITHSAQELEASHQRRAEARAAQPGFSVAPARCWVDGVMQAVPQQQTYVAPAQPMEQARSKNREDASRGTRPTAEGQHIPYTPEERAQQQRRENQYAKCEHYCREYNLAYLPTPEEWVRGELAYLHEAQSRSVPPDGSASLDHR